jgi:hypothetical protein
MKDNGRIALRPRWRAVGPKPVFAVLTVPALIACAACGAPPRATCQRLATGEVLNGIALREIGSGAVSGYKIIDRNNLEVIVEASNSAEWACRRVT